jgi:hypothetical protein
MEAVLEIKMASKVALEINKVVSKNKIRMAKIHNQQLEA